MDKKTNRSPKNEEKPVTYDFEGYRYRIEFQAGHAIWATPVAPLGQEALLPFREAALAAYRDSRLKPIVCKKWVPGRSEPETTVTHWSTEAARGKK